jgi:hypothetical protein
LIQSLVCNPSFKKILAFIMKNCNQLVTIALEKHVKKEVS